MLKWNEEFGGYYTLKTDNQTIGLMQFGKLFHVYHYDSQYDCVFDKNFEAESLEEAKHQAYLMVHLHTAEQATYWKKMFNEQSDTYITEEELVC